MREFAEIAGRTAGQRSQAYGSRLKQLADLYRRLGRYSDSADLLSRALMIDADTLGHSHPTSLDTIAGMALSHKLAGRLGEAFRSYQLRKPGRTAGLDRRYSTGAPVHGAAEAPDVAHRTKHGDLDAAVGGAGLCARRIRRVLIRSAAWLARDRSGIGPAGCDPSRSDVLLRSGAREGDLRVLPVVLHRRDRGWALGSTRSSR